MVCLLCAEGLLTGLQVADTYSYNVSVFVVDNSDPDTALEELEKLTSYTHFRLVILGPTLDWAVKGALRQVKHVASQAIMLPFEGAAGWYIHVGQALMGQTMLDMLA